jgi:hypothetical protein
MVMVTFAVLVGVAVAVVVVVAVTARVVVIMVATNRAGGDAAHSCAQDHRADEQDE